MNQEIVEREEEWVWRCNNCYGLNKRNLKKEMIVVGTGKFVSRERKPLTSYGQTKVITREKTKKVPTGLFRCVKCDATGNKNELFVSVFIEKGFRKEITKMVRKAKQDWDKVSKIMDDYGVRLTNPEPTKEEVEEEERVSSFCKECGAKLSEDQKFCDKCGSEI